MTRKSTAAPDTSASRELAPRAALAPLESLLEQLRSTRDGLTSIDAAARYARSAAARTRRRRGATAIRDLWRALASPVAAILVVAAVTSAFLGQIADAAIIVTMVVLSASVDVWQSARSARALRSLEARAATTATVRRDGAWSLVPRAEVVPGDVVRLSAGDLVPADVRLLESLHLHVDQAALTGESMPAEKAATEGALASGGPDCPALAYAGTSVLSGAANAVVFAAGADTEFGDIASRLAARPDETEFERGTRRFGNLILQTISFLVLLVLVVSFATGRDAMTSLLFALALAVGLTPEYLPMITTATLAEGALAMARDKVIVRHLASIQNLGSIDVLCSDKTGTLTSGRMGLHASLDPLGRPSTRALALARINSASQTGVKSPLDDAITQAGPREEPNEHRKLAEIPFDADRRMLSVLVEREGVGTWITKGAPESVIERCDRVALGEQERALDDSIRAACLDHFRQLSADGYRVLAVAYRDVARDVSEHPEDDPERGLVLAGLLTFADEMLDGVAQTIARLREDGIVVKILSGDNDLVTRTLCRRAGLEVGQVVLGAEVAKLDERALGALAERADVFARVSPADKHRVVSALKHRGHVVGFMGDGINDAPSLHAADVGISVAGAVTIAREASDIVLLERRLEVLHAGIVAGRRSFANVLKYLLMGTSSNFGNVLSMAAAVVLLPFLPMLPTQILVNNFLYDLAQVTIPTDRVDRTYLKGPQRWDIGVVRRFMWTMGPISSVFDLLTFAVFLLVFDLGESLFQTGWFVESLSTQVLVVFVIRTVGRPWVERPSTALTVTALVVVAIGAALPYSPLAPMLGMEPLPGHVLAFVGGIVPAYLVVVELVKARIMQRALGARARRVA